MNLRLVNADPRYTKVKLIEPSKLGYLHIAAEVAPRPFPLLPNGHEKSELLRRIKILTDDLTSLPVVERVTLFDSVAFAPPSSYVKEQSEKVQVAQFDLVVLIETTSPETICDVQNSRAYQDLVEALKSRAKRMHIIAAHNVKRIGDVSRKRNSLFLFNYFIGDDSQVTLDLWDYMADWYKVETGLDTSVLLAPLQGEHSDYHIINYASWEASLLRFLFRQMTKKSFRSYMLANLEANHVGAMPALYRFV